MAFDTVRSSGPGVALSGQKAKVASTAEVVGATAPAATSAVAAAAAAVVDATAFASVDTCFLLADPVLPFLV